MFWQHFGLLYFNILDQLSVKTNDTGSDNILTLNFGCCVLMT